MADVDWNEIAPLFRNGSFPRSNAYDPRWVAENQMGPNALWLMEWLCADMALKPGMRVLDLGCGQAMSSIFLASEFGVLVFATDLWIAAADNRSRVDAAGLQEMVFPIHAEAHALPFSEGFFDAIVSVDAYNYFGTDDLYMGYIARFLKPGGKVGIVVPGLVEEFESGPPEHVLMPQKNGRIFWEPDCCSFHSPKWWRRHWEKSGRVAVEKAELMPDGWKHWAAFERAVEASGLGVFPSDEEILLLDAGRNIGLVKVVAARPATSVSTGPEPHVWEPAFMSVVKQILGTKQAAAEKASSQVKAGKSRKKKPVLAFLYNVRGVYPDPDDPKGQLEADFDDRETIEEISRVLEGMGLEVIGIEADENAFETLKANRSRITLALNYSMGRTGLARYAQIPAILEMLGIPYTGSDPLVQGIVQDKGRMQAILAAHGIPVPPSSLLHSPDQKVDPRLEFPMLVKPVSQGSSAGITKKSLVRNRKQLREQVAAVIETFGPPALVQTFLDGREFSVPLLGNPPRVFPPIEPDFSKLPPDWLPFDSLEVKWYFEEENESNHLVCPAKTDAKTKKLIERTVLGAWNALGIRDWCRIDLRADEKGRLYVLDVNSPPGILPPAISTTSYFPLSARVAGMSYEDLLRALLIAAAGRTGRRLSLRSLQSRKRY